MKIVSFVDGSAYTQSVLDLSVWAAQRLGATVDVVHAIGRRDTETPMDWSGNLSLGARSALLKELAEHDAKRARLKQERGRLLVDTGVAHLAAQGISGHGRLRRGDVVEAVHELEADADLVVIGKRGEAANFAKLHLGSNLERVARTTVKPLLVAARAFKPVERFMIAYDGGPSADRAVAFIVNNALFTGLECHLVMAGRESGTARSKLSEAEGKLQAQGHSVVTHLEDQEPEKLISDYVTRAGIGLLVMGAYGHSRVRNLIIGSTTTEMIRSVLIPVMLFR